MPPFMIITTQQRSKYHQKKKKKKNCWPLPEVGQITPNVEWFSVVRPYKKHDIFQIPIFWQFMKYPDYFKQDDSNSNYPRYLNRQISTFESEHDDPKLWKFWYLLLKFIVMILTEFEIGSVICESSFPSFWSRINLKSY